MAIATSTALLLAGTAVAAIGTISSGFAESDRSDFEAADQRQRAIREGEIAAQSERDFRKKEDAIAAARRDSQGGSGVQGSTGSPLLAAADFAAEEELQARRIRAGGATNQSRLLDQARLTKEAGKSAKTRGFFRAGASLLTGAGKAFS